MSWFWKKRPPTAPDGTPLSDWDCYKFAPKHDITTYELALIVKMAAGCTIGITSLVPWTEGLNVKRSDPASGWPDWLLIKRHFNYVGSADRLKQF